MWKGIECVYMYVFILNACYRKLSAECARIIIFIGVRAQKQKQNTVSLQSFFLMCVHVFEPHREMKECDVNMCGMNEVKTNLLLYIICSVSFLGDLYIYLDVIFKSILQSFNIFYLIKVKFFEICCKTFLQLSKRFHNSVFYPNRAATFTTVEEEEDGEVADGAGGGACQVGETPPPTPPPPVMPTPPMSTKVRFLLWNHIRWFLSLIHRVTHV